MKTICGEDCCEQCTLRPASCAGCRETDGHPCGGNCCAAECIKAGGFEAFAAEKNAVLAEANALAKAAGLEGFALDDLCLLNGRFVNLAYPLPNGQTVPLLNDSNVYWGWRIPKPGTDRFFGVVADGGLMILSEYGENCEDPKLLVYSRRGK